MFLTLIRYMLVAATTFAMGYGCCRHITGQYDTSANAARWMPEGASDGAFEYGPSFLMFGPPEYHYEFTISEQDFRNFARSERRELKEITGPRYIARYLARFTRRDDYDGTEAGENRYRQAEGVTVQRGLYYHWQHEDKLVHYVFDRDRSRAYLEIHAR
ncbi:hypothetical protein ACXR0O_11825 [Verrucomicrobiota bacterium sgz303538]